MSRLYVGDPTEPPVGVWTCSRFPNWEDYEQDREALERASKAGRIKVVRGPFWKRRVWTFRTYRSGG